MNAGAQLRQDVEALLDAWVADSEALTRARQLLGVIDQRVAGHAAAVADLRMLEGRIISAITDSAAHAELGRSAGVAR